MRSTYQDHPDREYMDALEQVMKQGQDQKNRTNVMTRSLFGLTLRFQLRSLNNVRNVEEDVKVDNFPVLTTKKMAFKQVVGELLAFIRGYDNVHDFHKVGCRIWDANEQAGYWKPYQQRSGDLGRVYGVQWRDWTSVQMMDVNRTRNPLPPHTKSISDMNPKEFAHHFGLKPLAPLPEEFDFSSNDLQGRKPLQDLINPEGYRPVVVRIDQLASCIEQIRRTPESRRICMTTWNPGEFGFMALEPCHVFVQFYVDQLNGRLSVQMYQRSCDMFLGVPFNISSYGLLLCMVAHVTGLRPHILTMCLGDAHIYHNHIEQVTEQLERKPTEPARLIVRHRSQIDDFQPADFGLDGYHPHPALKVDMVV